MLRVVFVLPVLQIAMVAVRLLSLAIEEQARAQPEQEGHLLSEQVPELVTDGQEHQSEARHRVIPMLQAVLLLVVTTPHVLPQRVLRVLEALHALPVKTRAIARLVELGQEREL